MQAPTLPWVNQSYYRQPGADVYVRGAPRKGAGYSADAGDDPLSRAVAAAQSHSGLYNTEIGHVTTHDGMPGAMMVAAPIISTALTTQDVSHAAQGGGGGAAAAASFSCRSCGMRWCCALRH